MSIPVSIENIKVGNADILAGSTDPSSVGLEAALGSIYLRSNGTIWLKTNTENTDWEELILAAAAEELFENGFSDLFNAAFTTAFGPAFADALDDELDSGFSNAVDAYCGDGSDLDITVPAGTTVTATREMNILNLTIESGATYNTGGYPIRVKNNLIFTDSTSKVSRAGTNGGNASTGTGGSGGTGNSGGILSGGTNGGAGGITGNASNNITSSYQGNVAVGGASGRGNFNAAAAAGTITSPLAASNGDVRSLPQAIIARTSLGTAVSFVATGGAGGAGAQFSNQAYGGGGGGGGGWLTLCAKNIVHLSGTGVVTVAGGNGGNAFVHAGVDNVGGGGGGGGGGGVLCLVYGSGVEPTLSFGGGGGGSAASSGTPVPAAPTNGSAGGSGIKLIFKL